MLAGERLLAVLELLLQALVEPRVLDRVRRDARVQVHQTQLALGGAARAREEHRQDADDVPTPREERGAVTGSEAGVLGGRAVGGEDRIGGHVLDHHLAPLREGGAAGAASRPDVPDLVEELPGEPGLHRQREAGALRLAEGQEPLGRARYRDRGLEHFPEHRLDVEVSGETDRHLVQAAEVLDLYLELLLHGTQRELDRAPLGDLRLQRRGLTL